MYGSDQIRERHRHRYEFNNEYREQLTQTLKETGDPRVLGYDLVWENYPRIQGAMRYFPNPRDEEHTP